MIKGFSFIWGKDILYLSKYVRGYWFDDNNVNYKPPGSKTGFGIKIDLAVDRVVRPIPYFWELGFWKKDKPVIQDILDAGEKFAKDYFGNDLYEQIILLSPHHWIKRTVYNPWYARHAFVLRIPSFVWPSISIGTPWISFHIGSKSFKVDPFTRDRTWCGHKERALAEKEKPYDRFYALALSTTLRNTRD